MSPYTHVAPPSDYALCSQLCILSVEKGTKIGNIRKLWGRQAPIVKCCGKLFLMSNDDFKTLSGHYAGEEKK